MPAEALAIVLDCVRQVIRPLEETEATDAELLNRFTLDRDERAFAFLVRRHGPLVQSVCRRQLSDRDAAADVFQATFLVLARKAGSIRAGASLSAWLHRVTVRLAVATRTAAERRRSVEREIPIRSSLDPSAQLIRREFEKQLEAELIGLPDKYRLPVVLCFFEGKTHAEAARELGWPLGTLAGRLARAKDLLRVRLSRCGWSTPVGLVSAALAGEARAISASLTKATVAAAVRFVANPTATSSAAMVANIFLQTAPTLSFRLVGLIVLAAAALAAGGGIFAAVPSALPSAEKADAASPQPTSPQAAADRFGDPLPAGALARLGTVRLRHDEVISCVIVAADGNSFMAADWDGVVRLWDTSTGRLIRQLKNRDGKIFCATLSPDGKTAATGNWDGAVRLWDTSTGDVTLALKPFSKEVNALTFTPDGKRLVGTSGSLGDDSNSIAMWNVSDGQQIWRNEETTGMVESLSVSPDGALIFCLEWSRLLTARDASSGKERYHASFGAADGSRPRIANSTAVKLLAVEGGHDSIHLLAQETGKVVRRIESPAGSPMAFTPDGKSLVRVVDEFFQVWDVESGRRLRRFSAAGGGPASLAFTPDGRTLIAGGTDHRVRLYDFVDGKERPIADGHDGPVSVAFAANGAVVTAGDATVRFWNPRNSEPVRILTGGGPINSLAVSPDGRFAVTANYSKRDTDRPAQLWDLTARRASQTLEGIGQGRPKVAISPDGRTVAASGDPIHVWNVADGKERKRWQGLGGSTTEIAFSPDGQTLAAGGDVQSVTLFDPATGKPVKVLTASGLPSGASATGLSFAPDGKTITACFCGREDAPPSQDDMVRAWDIATGREIGRRPTSSGAVSAMALSADGRLLALGFPSGIVTLFETLTNTEIATYSGHTRRVVSLAFAPDGLSLASGSADTTALLWDLTGGRRTTVHSVPTHLAQDQLAENWKSLGGETRLARQALWNLVAAGDGCVMFLEKMLRPKAALNAADVRRLLTDLDSDDFNRREAALSVLENHGEAVASQLKQAAEAAPSAEVRRRIVGLLENADGRQSSPGRLRRFRAVEALEQIGTRTARRLLADLATAESESELGAAARAAGARLASRE